MTAPLWITWHKACLMLQTSIWFDLARKMAASSLS
jgi:hypothetical protein